MDAQKHNIGSLLTSLLLSVSAIMLVISIVYAPDEAFKAALHGLSVWWNVVFPSLLPFLVLSQMLIAYGFAHGLGTLIDPFIRRWLGIPGVGGFVLPLGMTAGFPAAADASKTLYITNKLTADEAEKLSAISHYSNPMLLIVVIGTGFLQQPRLGLLLLIVHWLAGLAAGITLHRLTPSQRKSSPLLPSEGAGQPRIRSQLTRAIYNMEEARREDGRSFGKLLGDSVTVSVQTLMVVGGYMLIFAVVISIIARLIPSELGTQFIAPLLEVHLGSYAISNVLMPSLAIKIACLGAILGWSGICAWMQVKALLKPAGLRSGPFMLVRLMHGAYAYVITLLLWTPFVKWIPGALPAYQSDNPGLYSIDIERNHNLLHDLPARSPFSFALEWQLPAFVLLVSSCLVITIIWHRRSA